ncbi:hypothetical protein HNY73_020602 [Argiope bruennichi]|uniref:Uncharacterized protein n=1 Tax=Argiope bruennichi TaxID=94029 RepID=A0A8T0E871_ARGBR|nr:hypothetical protein HNY73_020602 [Argiope bruennichi]
MKESVIEFPLGVFHAMKTPSHLNRSNRNGRKHHFLPRNLGPGAPLEIRRSGIMIQGLDKCALPSRVQWDAGIDTSKRGQGPTCGVSAPYWMEGFSCPIVFSLSGARAVPEIGKRPDRRTGKPDKKWALSYQRGVSS